MVTSSETQTSTEERLATSPVWNLLIRNNSSTMSCTACVPGDPDCWMLFPHIAEYLKVNLDALSQIFVRNPQWVYSRQPKKQPKQATASNYLMPGCYLRHSRLALRGWGSLAKLLGKTLILINTHGTCEGYPDHIAFPDGRVEEFDQEKHRPAALRATK